MNEEQQALMEETRKRCVQMLEKTLRRCESMIEETKKESIKIQEAARDELDQIMEALNQAQNQFMKSYKEIHKIMNDIPEFSIDEDEEDLDDIPSDQSLIHHMEDIFGEEEEF